MKIEVKTPAAMIHRERRRYARQRGGKEDGGRVDERQTHTRVSRRVVDIVYRVGTCREG